MWWPCPEGVTRICNLLNFCSKLELSRALCPNLFCPSKMTTLLQTHWILSIVFYGRLFLSPINRSCKKQSRESNMFGARIHGGQSTTHLAHFSSQHFSFCKLDFLFQFIHQKPQMNKKSSLQKEKC